MFCNNCGNEIKGNEMFCTKCGARLERVSNVADKAEPHTFKREKRSSSIVSKLIAAASSVLLFISVFVPFLTGTSIFGLSEQYSVNELFGEYPVVILILMLFTALFLILQLTNHKGFSVIGIAGVWLWAIVMCSAISSAASDSYARYSFEIGIYLLFLGMIGQVVAMIKK